MLSSRSGNDEGAKASDASAAGLDALNDQGIIDTKLGIKHCGGEEVYIDILKTFCDAADENDKQLRGFIESGEIKEYTIKIHSLKSSARTIGAGHLGETAKELEDAGKREDMDFIRKNHDKFIEEYMMVKDMIEKSIT